MKTVRVEPEAKQELAAAAAWYEERREGLGLELVAEVDAVFAAIARNPSRRLMPGASDADALSATRAFRGRARPRHHFFFEATCLADTAACFLRLASSVLLCF